MQRFIAREAQPARLGFTGRLVGHAALLVADSTVRARLMAARFGVMAGFLAICVWWQLTHGRPIGPELAAAVKGLEDHLWPL